MKSLCGIAMSDGINRKNHMFPFSTLHNSYAKSWKKGIPSNLSHDSTKPIGWTYFTGIYIEAGKAYLTNSTMLAETEEDWKILKDLLEKQTQNHYVVEHEEEIHRLEVELGGVLAKNKRIAPVSAIAFDEPGIVLRVFPELEELIDDDGLIELCHLDPVLPGIFRRGNFLIFAHRYFRRSYSLVNSLNDEFLNRLQNVSEQCKNLKVRVRIDLDMIGLLGTEKGELEYEYWWGPYFNDDLENIPFGVTRYKNEFYDNLFSNLNFTEFGWYTQDNNKTLEIEEVNDRPTIIADEKILTGCRYIHSFLNSRTNLPTHLDGAVRAYSDELLLERLDLKLNQTERNTVYTKLWRIDGDMPIGLWKELITHYYRDNHLVGEYFGGKDEKFDLYKIEDQKRNVITPCPLEKFVPTNISQGDGLRIYYHYQPAFSASEYDVETNSKEFIILNDTRNHAESLMKVMETETITVLKLLKRYGCSIRIPNTARVAHEDMIFNFPVFYCKNVDAASYVQGAMLDLCEAWNKNRDDRLISFSIALNINKDISVQVSFAGHVSDFVKVYHLLGTKFPEEPNFLPWIEKLYHLNSSFKESHTKPNPLDMISNSGELYIQRRLVPSQMIKRYSVDRVGVSAELTMSKEELSLKEKLCIGISPVTIIRSSKCTRCGKEYRDCNCIKFIDDTTEEIKDIRFLGCTWTNRHA